MLGEGLGPLTHTVREFLSSQAGAPWLWLFPVTVPQSLEMAHWELQGKPSPSCSEPQAQTVSPCLAQHPTKPSSQGCSGCLHWTHLPTLASQWSRTGVESPALPADHDTCRSVPWLHFSLKCSGVLFNLCRLFFPFLQAINWESVRKQSPFSSLHHVLSLQFFCRL